MKLFWFFKGHKVAVIICALLLVIQANLELALPNYMSNIVDVGLQQGGIESPVPEVIGKEALGDLELFMTPKDAATVDGAYGPPNGDGLRAYTGSPAKAAPTSELARLFTLPECVVLALEDGIDLSSLSNTGFEKALSVSELDPAQLTPDQARALQSLKTELAANGNKLTVGAVRTLYEAGLVAREDLVSAAQSMNDALGDVASTMLEQRAIAYVQRLYEKEGVDLVALQNRYLTATAFAMFGLCLGTLAVTVAVGFVASRTSATIARDTRRSLFNHVMEFSPAEVNAFSQASLITRTTNDVQQVQMVCVVLLRMVMLAPIMGVVAFAQVTATHSGMEWVIAVALIAIFAVLGILLGVTMPRFKRMQALVDRLNLVSRDMLDGLMPIRAFGREDYELDRFDGASKDLMKNQLFVNRAMTFMMPIIMFVMNLVALLIVWVGSHGVDAGTLQVGTMMAFITYTMQIVMSFMILGMVAVMLPRAQVSAERIWDVIECPLTITDPATPKAPFATGPTGLVEFDHVSFCYPDAERPVIHDVSFQTHAGKTLGIIGSTGSGKSTLVKLIPRLFDASEGAVRLDGVDVREMELKDLRHRIGFVPQQGFLFSGTVASNIKFANEAMEDARMERAAEISQAKEFIDRMPEGFETPIAQGGSNVSGGQRQRLSIARALAMNPEVLVFDDSFSALDYATDARLRAALKKGAGKAAVIIVAQRVATIMQADEILVLDSGTVVGCGTHKELIGSCKTYREIALSQLSAKELGLNKTAPEATDVFGASASKKEAVAHG